MNRADLQSLAALRLAEAKSLLAAGHPSGAYYLAGYAVKCGLKAAIAKQTRQYDFPDKQRAANSFVHDFKRLVETAGLAQALDAALAGDPLFRRHWQTVDAWSERSRYEQHGTGDAQGMISAVEDASSGVLP